MSLLIYKLNEEAIVPTRHSEEAVGYDLHTIEAFTMWPGQAVTIGTGLVVQPPPGYHTEIILRSSLAFKFDIILRNSVGVIDRDYSGPGDELRLMLYRLPSMSCFGVERTAFLKRFSPVSFNKGDRIAQLVIRETHHFPVELVTVPPKDVGRGGLGSTGR